MLSELATDTIVEIIDDIIDNIDNKNVNEKNIINYLYCSNLWLFIKCKFSKCDEYMLIAAAGTLIRTQ